jgi:hypothetical protein
MHVWVTLGAVMAVALVTSASGLRVRRYSRGHLVAQLAVRGRGLFISRTPDGTWWRIRLRARRRVCEDRSGWTEPPPDCGVREPREPMGPGGPGTGAVELRPPR